MSSTPETTITLKFTPAELELLDHGLGIYTSDYEGTAQYDRHAEAVGQLSGKLRHATRAPAPDHTTRALSALLDAVDSERDFAEWLVHLVASTAVVSGRDLCAGRPGSWESAAIRDMLGSAGAYTEYAQEMYGRDDPRGGGQ